jgi:tripartite-type tricarboxylate transporter receptor subunit TctC
MARARVGCARAVFAAVLITAAAYAAPVAQAQSVADFYKGNRITLYVTAPPGGGYDLNARTLARYFGKHVPGNPLVIIQTMPGANGMIAANYVYNVAPKDGTAIWSGGRTVPYAPLFNIQGARHDVTKLSWLGSTASDVGMVVVWHTAPHQTAEDLFKTELIVGATDPAADTYFFPYVLNNLIGTKFRITPGYRAQPPILLAMERGEVQGSGNVGLDSLLAAHPDWIRDKKVRLLMQLGLAKHPSMPDPPLVMDFARTDEQRRLLTVFMSMKRFGYPFFIGPDVPADRVQALRTAFMDTMRDPEFLAETAQQRRELSPVSGEDMQHSLQESYSLPPDLLEKMRAVIPK